MYSSSSLFYDWDKDENTGVVERVQHEIVRIDLVLDDSWMLAYLTNNK